jgi:hypothetical protein
VRGPRAPKNEISAALFDLAFDGKLRACDRVKLPSAEGAQSASGTALALAEEQL